jgi:DNA-binding MarR family transcriptional regulator
VLSKQLKVLQEAGYVTLRKESFNSRIHAWVALTPLGRTVFTAHMAELRRVADEAVADKAVADGAVADGAVTDDRPPSVAT